MEASASWIRIDWLFFHDHIIVITAAQHVIPDGCAMMGSVPGML